MNKYRPKYQKLLGSPLWKLLLLLPLLGALILPFLSQCSYQEDGPTVSAQSPPSSVPPESDVPTAPTQASESETLPGTEPPLFPPTEQTEPIPETLPSEAAIASLPLEEPTEDSPSIPETQTPEATDETLPPETTVETQPHVHDFHVESVLHPTCTESGYTLLRCNCGETMQDDHIPPLGHQYEQSPAESEGFIQYICIRCADSYQEEAPLGPTQATEHVHKFHAVKTAAPTCTNVGYTLERCSCGLAQRIDLVPALNHQMEITVIPPASGVQGYTLHQCSRCSFHFRSDIKAPLP